MKILSFDTCWQACSVCVAEVQTSSTPSKIDILAHEFAAMATGQAEALPVMLRDVLAKAGCTAHDIDRIAVPYGPGSFTGVRISVAAARALSLSTGADIVACSSLALIAAGVLCAPDRADFPSPAADQDLLVAMDARRGEVYAQVFGPDPDWSKVAEPQLLKLPDAVDLTSTPSFAVIGTAARQIADEATKMGRTAKVLSNDDLPDAKHLARMAPTMKPLSAPLMPVYIRPPDAKPSTKPPIQRATSQSV